ncbi:MAG: hypothetical protein LBN43_04250 [Oscillospiraceae bacterium]|jgi:hypothetical protein|nr:hypothetical protein [Oscillospiraceae bacterium]
MKSEKLQSAMTAFGQIDALLEMIIAHLLNAPINTHDRAWFEKMENAIYLLEETYKAKKANLVSALEGGEDSE